MIKFSQEDKKIHWQFVVARKFSPFYEYIFSTATGLGTSAYKAVLGYKHSYRRMDLDGELFYCSEDILKEKKELLRQVRNNINLIAKRAIQAEKEGKRLMELAYSIRNKKIDKLTNRQIQKILLQLLHGFYRFVPFLMMPLAIENYLEEELSRYLDKKHNGDEVEIKKAKALILVPSKENLQEEEQLSILELAEEFRVAKKITVSLETKIKKHLNRFDVLGLRYGVGDIWNRNDIIKRVRHLSRENPSEKYKKLILDRKDTKQQFQELIKKLKPNKRIAKIIKIIREYIYLRTYRTNVLNNSLAVAKPFLEGVAKRLGVDWNILNYLILPEVLESLALRKIPEKFLKEAEKRKSGFATIFIRGKFFIFTGKEIQELASFWGLKQKTSKKETIKGIAANSGKVRGIVRILYAPADNEKVNKGDILVTSMTTPNFVPAMERAAAFITDEGGILCHAAIVSREMHKPCIIGTKIATKVLKDGQLVEVDADKGVIKIIKKSK